MIRKTKKGPRRLRGMPVFSDSLLAPAVRHLQSKGFEVPSWATERVTL